MKPQDSRQSSKEKDAVPCTFQGFRNLPGPAWDRKPGCCLPCDHGFLGGPDRELLIPLPLKCGLLQLERPSAVCPPGAALVPINAALEFRSTLLLEERILQVRKKSPGQYPANHCWQQDGIFCGSIYIIAPLFILLSVPSLLPGCTLICSRSIKKPF